MEGRCSSAIDSMAAAGCGVSWDFGTDVERGDFFWEDLRRTGDAKAKASTMGDLRRMKCGEVRLRFRSEVEDGDCVLVTSRAATGRLFGEAWDFAGRRPGRARAWCL